MQPYSLPTLLRNLANLIEANEGVLPKEFTPLFTGEFQTPKPKSKRKPKVVLQKETIEEIREIVKETMYGIKRK